MIKALKRWWKARSAAPAPAPSITSSITSSMTPSTAPSMPAPPTVPAARPAAIAETAPSGLLFQIRPFSAADTPALARVCHDAIQITAAEHYNAAQRGAWCDAFADAPSLGTRLARGITMVAEWQQETTAFAQLLDDGHLDLIYVHPDVARLGIATLLYQHLEDEARLLGLVRLTTDASRTARDFFLSLGFTTLTEDNVQRQGVTLSRWAMEKRLI